MSRREFPKSVKKAALIRCSQPDGVPKCEECGMPLRAGRFQYDHDKADGLGGEPTLENCVVLCSGSKTSCHSLKTETHDKPLMQKADNMRDYHLGTTRKKVKIPSPPRAPKRPSKPSLPPRQFYRDIA